MACTPNLHIYPPPRLPPLPPAATSYLNRTEATNVEKVITRFLQCGVNPSQIGVITPYEGQRAHIMSVLLRQGVLRQDLYKVRLRWGGFGGGQGGGTDGALLGTGDPAQWLAAAGCGHPVGACSTAMCWCVTVYAGDRGV